MDKIIISGGNGMLGSMLGKILSLNNYDVISLDRSDLDITNRDNIESVIQSHKPKWFINCAAYTNVEQAEEDIETSNNINGIAPGFLAKECKNENIGFIHISTDYVFSSNNLNGYTEDEDPGNNQTSQYAKSKRIGEIEVLKNNPESYILRTSWIFGPGGKNFVDSMLKLAESKSELNIVDDEIGVPTYTKDISNQILYLVKNHESLNPGFYHAISEGECSRYVQAKTIFELAGKNIKLNPIHLKDYPRKAQVPSYSVLLNTKLTKLQNWNEAIEEYIKSQ